MVHLKIILDTRRKKSDGTYPIAFRIINVKKVHLIPTGVSVNEIFWDLSKLNLKNTHPNARTINIALSKKYYEIQKAILQIEEAGSFCFEELKSKLSPEKPKSIIDKSFLNFANKVVDDFLQVKRTGNALIYRTAINRLIEFTGNSKIEFKDIDFTLLDRFQNELVKDGMRKNTIGNYFRSIRALYNKAIKAKLVTRDSYPFHDISIKTEKTAKRAIGVGEISQLYQYPKKPNSQEWHAANFFFLSFVLRGISFTDMAYLTKQNIYKGCLTYRRRKTKKLYTIKLHPVALRIFNFYKDNQSGYLLPVFPKGIIEDSVEAQKVTRQWIKVTNKYLNRIAMNCKIDNNITTYVTRHTWATTAKRLGYPNEMIAEAMGHEYGNKITNIYLEDFDQKLIDEMNDKVILSVIPCLKQIINHYRFILAPSISLSKYKQQKTDLKLYLIA